MATAGALPAEPDAAGPGPAELGTAVVPFPQRHPLMLASQALTIQAATGNRLTLGIGVGIAWMVDSMFGLPTDRPCRQPARVPAGSLRPLLRGEAVDHHGETLTAAVGRSRRRGCRRAVPVLVAALGPAMLRVTAELADGTITWMNGTPRTLEEYVVPSITISRTGPLLDRVVAGLHVCLTTDHRRRRERGTQTDFALSGQVPEYRAVLDREGVSGPADILITGDERSITKQLDRLRDTGLSDASAGPDRHRGRTAPHNGVPVHSGAVTSPRHAAVVRRGVVRICGTHQPRSGGSGRWSASARRACY